MHPRPGYVAPKHRLPALLAAALLALLLGAQWEGVSPAAPVVAPPPAERGGRAPAFEENRGQFDARASFVARGPTYSQFVTETGVVWRLEGSQPHAVEMSFPGAARAQPRGEGALAATTNYLKGRDSTRWVTGARRFSAVVLGGLYPGVDLRLHADRDVPEYDFIVAPHADASRIRVRFAGADSVSIGAAGELSVRTGAGELIHHTPVAYQRDGHGGTTWVDAKFVKVAAHELRLELGRYDTTREIVIDPVYEYSTYLGGTGSESMQASFAPDPWQAIAVNAAGEAYVGGTTNSADFPTTLGVLQPAQRADIDFFIAKLNAAGDALLYSTYVGGTGNELGVGGIHVNAAGQVLFAGTSQSDDFPTTAGAFDAVSGGGGGTDVVALKLNATGTALVYSTYLGSSANETLYGFGVDSQGRIVVAGGTVWNATVPFPITPGIAFDEQGDHYITKISADGSALAWSTHWGETFGGQVRIRALAIGPDDNVYITGLVTAPNVLPLVNEMDASFDGSFEAYFAVIHRNGTGIVYSSYLGGIGTDEPRSIAVDAAGNIYLAGNTGGGSPANNFPTTPGALRTTPSVNWQGYLTKVNPSGSAILWSTYLPGPNTSANNALAVDSSGRVHAAINSNPPLELRVNEPPETCLAYTSSPAVVRIAADGSAVEYGLRMGAPMVFTGGSDITANYVNDLALDPAGNVYVIGTTNSADFPTYRGAQSARAGATIGGSDAFVAKLSDAAPFAAPTLSFSAPTYSVTEGTGDAIITVNRTGRAGGPVKVRVTSSAGTAAATSDYTNVDVVLEWRNGDLAPKTVTVPIVNDAAAEAGETVNLSLTKNWCLGDLGTQATAVLTIGDAAPPPPPPPPPVPGTLQLSAATYAAGEGAGNASITVTRTGGSDGAVSARLATANGSATSGADYTATDVVVNFAAGDSAAKTVNVPVVQDATDEPDETVNLTLSAPTGGATLGVQTTAVLTVTDDDPTPVPPSPPAPPAPPGGGGGGGAADPLFLLGLLALVAIRLRRRARSSPT